MSKDKGTEIKTPCWQGHTKMWQQTLFFSEYKSHIECALEINRQEYNLSDREKYGVRWLW